MIGMANDAHKDGGNIKKSLIQQVFNLWSYIICDGILMYAMPITKGQTFGSQLQIRYQPKSCMFNQGIGQPRDRENRKREASTFMCFVHVEIPKSC